MPLPSLLPYGLGYTPGSDGLYMPSGFAYNVAIGGLPFLSAASRDNPIVRSTAPFRKQQIDQSNEPGEQSLDGWWLRSQQTFHGGAGQLFGDPSASDAAWSETRYYQSKGVDPWTPGQVSLLRGVGALTSSPVAQLASDGVQAVGILETDDVFHVSEDGVFLTDAVGMLGYPYSTIESIAMDSNRVFLATDTVLYKMDLDDYPSAGSWVDIWFTAESGDPAPTTVILGWVKERLVLATNHGIYEITDFDTGGANFLTLPRWTPPQGDWTPVSITESNSAIYVAGILNGQRSVILKFTLDANGAMPELTSGTVVANLPQGEIITSIFGYLGRYLAIGTTSGPRIAAVDDNGDLEVGPLLFSGAVGTWAARGQYLYGAAVLPEWEGSEGGLVRVDLGLDHDQLRFAYASDLYATSAGDGARAAGLITAGLLLATDGGLYLESADEFVDSGWVLGSRVRYSTLEPKVYKLLRVRGPILESDFFASVIDPDGNEYPVVGYVAGQTPGESDVALPNLGPLDYLSVKITLSATADNLTSATTGGYQLKSLPGQPRQRLLSLPLLCFDFEADRLGATAGGVGTALARLLALEAIDDAADTVTLQDFDAGTSDLVSIETVEFRQTAPPSGTTTDPNFGGIITLTVRKL